MTYHDSPAGESTMIQKMIEVALLLSLASSGVAAQSPPPRKDIPAIAKAANGAIVSIVMSDKEGKPIGQGSGFFVSKNGTIVTNYHVIAEGISAVVKLPNDTFYVIDGVLASDKLRDIAVIKAHGQNFRTLTLGNSDRVQIGEEVVAIGSPLSLESTVSNGIVSGIRTADELGGKFLQITAPISPGSSGRPLFNMAGKVVGITTMHIKSGENLNFAIPINDVKPLLLTRSSRLQHLPNEPESPEADAPPSATGEGPTVQMNSQAYRSYLELLKSGDTTVRGSTYACFSDDQQNIAFTLVTAYLISNETMLLSTQMFKNGVSETGGIGIFLGQVTFTGGLFATLHTKYDTKHFTSHETDVFEWGPDVLRMKTGFGKLSPGEVRSTYEFNMQRSTGRYTEHTVFDPPIESDRFTIDSTGKCIRNPNTQTPEEAYRSLESITSQKGGSTTTSTPDLKTTVESMHRMLEPEHRDLLLGVLKGAELSSTNAPSITIVSDQAMLMAVIDGTKKENGNPRFTYSVAADSFGNHEKKDNPRYMSFALGDIDPSSIGTMVGGYDLDALAEFWDKHPGCETNRECNHEYLHFLNSTAPKLTVVWFHATDLKPLIACGGCSGSSNCRLTETTEKALIFFRDKDRAERFVTALIYAVKLARGKP